MQEEGGRGIGGDDKKKKRWLITFLYPSRDEDKSDGKAHHYPLLLSPALPPVPSPSPPHPLPPSSSSSISASFVIIFPVLSYIKLRENCLSFSLPFSTERHLVLYFYIFSNSVCSFFPFIDFPEFFRATQRNVFRSLKVVDL